MGLESGIGRFIKKPPEAAPDAVGGGFAYPIQKAIDQAKKTIDARKQAA